MTEDKYVISSKMCKIHRGKSLKTPRKRSCLPGWRGLTGFGPTGFMGLAPGSKEDREQTRKHL